MVVCLQPTLCLFATDAKERISQNNRVLVVVESDKVSVPMSGRQTGRDKCHLDAAEDGTVEQAAATHLLS